ncbi:hypothetical protein M426DRAFT_316479 [Hypoxylon sp. CI-4A]|nr:hypothetical protein M426DRAFT_316479 [Hypoxylon sp. CI-4A]
MASNSVSEGSTHIYQNSQLPPNEDESEWEYEYSTTETETFYVTLDLSKVDFTSRDPIYTPGGGEKDGAKLYLNKQSSPNNSDDNSDDEEGEGPRNREPKQPRAREPTDDADDHQVQILELHSDNPIISYKGRVYSGQWSENVGTEFLLTRRDEENPLPVVRHLPGDVDLLAASSARITVKEKDLKPRDDGPKRQRLAHLRERIGPGSSVPPAERWASRERIEQGNFLADLIALKKRKGETDDVTVVAKTADVRPNHNKARKTRNNEPAGHRGKYNLPHRRGPRRPRGNEILRTLHIREGGEMMMLDGEEEEGEGEGVVGGGARSTPTPAQWADLEGRAGGGGVDGDGNGVDGQVGEIANGDTGYRKVRFQEEGEDDYRDADAGEDDDQAMIGVNEDDEEADSNSPSSSSSSEASDSEGEMDVDDRL